MKRMHWLLPGLILVLVLLGWWEGTPTAQAGVITVCPTGCDYDTIQGAVNAAAPSTTIQIFSATYTETVIITKTLTLEGVGQPQPVVSGNDVGRPFTILGSVAVTMTNMTVTRGRTPLEPDGTARGGGVYSQGELFLDTVTIRHNQAIGRDGVDPGEPGAVAYGGGLYVDCHHENSVCYQVQLQNVSVISNTVRGGKGGYGAVGGDAYGGGLAYPCQGVGVFCGNAAALHLIRVEVGENNAYGGDSGSSGGYPASEPGAGFGGGIFTNAIPYIEGSYIHHNKALKDTYIPSSGNDITESMGGGIYILALSEPGREGRIAYSTIAHNQTVVGGGIFLQSSGIKISNSTVSNNLAVCGGGVYDWSFEDTFFDYVTIIENTATITENPVTIPSNSPYSALCPIAFGGGIVAFTPGGVRGYPNLKSSIVASNEALNHEAPDCSAHIKSRGFNFISDTTDCFIYGNLNGNLVNQPIVLRPLQDNGGLTPTHALLAGSVAIDAAAPADCPATDQRNFARWVDGNGDGIARCDMGAYEYGGAPTDVGLVGTIRGRSASISPLLLSLLALTLLFYRLRGRTTNHVPYHDPKS